MPGQDRWHGRHVGHAGPLCWLEVRGTAQMVAQPKWAALLPGTLPAFRPAGRYQVVRLSPRRIDLFDEGQDWGARETLDVNVDGEFNQTKEMEVER